MTSNNTLSTAIVRKAILVVVPIVLITFLFVITIMMSREVMLFRSETKIHADSLHNSLLSVNGNLNTQTDLLFNFVQEVSRSSLTSSLRFSPGIQDQIGRFLITQMNNPQSTLLAVAMRVSNNPTLTFMNSIASANPAKELSYRNSLTQIIQKPFSGLEGQIPLEFATIDRTPVLVMRTSRPILQSFQISKRSHPRLLLDLVLLFDPKVLVNPMIEAQQVLQNLGIHGEFALKDSKSVLFKVGQKPKELISFHDDLSFSQLKSNTGPVFLTVTFAQPALITNLIFLFSCLFLTAVLIVVLLSWSLRRKLLWQMKPLALLQEQIEKLQSSSQSQASNSESKEQLPSIRSLQLEKTGFDDVDQVTTSFINLTSDLIRLEEEKSSLSKKADMLQMANQVAHDIRSPLAALNVATKMQKDIPEESRVVIRSAISRINDIANNLLQSAKRENTQTKTSRGSELKIETAMLSSLVDSIVSEKRMQFKNKVKITIEAKLDDSYGLFSPVDVTELSRAISNLINNSMEAIGSNSGCIQVVVSSEVVATESGKLVPFNVISILDNGPGIPAEIIGNLGQSGVTYGKAGSSSGHGLGLYQARTTMEKLQGRLKIESKKGKGTILSLQLPQAQSPQWFVEKIDIGSGTCIVTVDDDPTIHQTWRERFNAISSPTKTFTHFGFSSIQQFESWFGNAQLSSVLFLVDYEFIGQSMTGLDLIVKHSIIENSILTSSHIENPRVQERASAIGLKLLPKSLAPVVPVGISKAGTSLNSNTMEQAHD